MLAQVAFDGTDVRDALRWLFRQAHVGGTVAPDVQGMVTVSLRNVPWEVALQNVTRQVDATYRIEHGWFEVVRRPEERREPYMEDEADGIGRRERWNGIETRYARLRTLVDLGRGRELRESFAPDFRFQDATATRQGESGGRLLIDTFRTYPRLTVVSAHEIGKQHPHEEVVVAYDPPGATTRYFRDVWSISLVQRLELREETAIVPTRLRYVDVPLSEVLDDLSKRTWIAIRLDPSLDRPITLDLTGLTFVTILQRLTQDCRLTYRIEGGVYIIVPHE